jgi:hypothetical protein
VDPDERPAAKFRRLGRQRMTKALNMIKLVGNLSAYAHDQDDADRIVTTLNEAVKGVELRFKARERGAAEVFEL